MDVNNLTSVYNQNPTLQSQYTLQQYLDLFGGSSTGTTGTTAQTQTTTPTSNASQGIIGSNINQYQTGGEGGNNPYMPNANVNTSYQPNYDYRQHIDYDPNLTATANQKQFDMYQNYYNKPAPSGIAKAINTGINMIPGIGTIKRGVEFVGGALKGVLPVNQRALMENELRGSGIYTDSIGRMAVGPDGKYNTPEGIMAGYNASQMDPTKENNAWDRRTSNITESLVDRTSLTAQEIADIVSEIEETGKYSGTLTDEQLGVKNLFSNLVNVNMNKYMFGKTKKKAQDIFDFEVQKKEKERKEKEAAKKQKALYDQIAKDKGQAYLDMAKENAARRNREQPGNTTNVTGHGKSGLGRDPDRWKAAGGLALARGGRVGLENGGAPLYSESDFPKLLNPFRPTGEKPSLSDYDEDIWDYDVIEIPMGGKMKRYKKFKKRKGGRRRSRSYFDGGLVSLRRR